MKLLRTIVFDILIFILVNVLCFSLVCPTLMNNAIQNDTITQEMTHKVMTVINQYTYKLPEISLDKIQSDISTSKEMKELTDVYSQAILKQIATGEENKQDMTPYINNLAESSFSIIEKDTDITLPEVFKTTVTSLISSGLVAQGIDQYVTEFINKQSPKKLKVIKVIYQLTLDQNRMIIGIIIVVLCLLELLLDKLKGLRSISLTGILSGLSVGFIMPVIISNGASSYLNRTIVFDHGILRTPGLMISGICLVIFILSQILIIKKNKSQF